MKLWPRKPKRDRLPVVPLRGEGPFWTCHFCGDWRPDGKIDVAATTRLLGRVEVRYTRRYCNDREECREKAVAWQTSEHPERMP